MHMKSQVLFILFAVSLILLISITGCVEVAPPSGGQNASAYGLSSTGGDLKNGSENPQNSSQSQQGTGDAQQGNYSSEGAPNASMPPVPNESFVKVTPRDYDELSQDRQVSYLQYNRPQNSTDKQYITIYNLTNQSFSRNASAYAYDLVSPPLYIDLLFYPKMITDELERYKRTGDKEGTVVYNKIRPSQDSWFEMRIYDQDTNEEILREGYGKTYSLTNKTAAVRQGGRLQFDFMGDEISADIIMKIPVNSSAYGNYSQVSSLLDEKKVESGLLPGVYLILPDFAQGWQQSGDSIHTSSQYSSIFILPSTGSKLVQDISRFGNSQDTIAAYQQTKDKNAGESMITVLNGDEGYGYESVRKTGVVYRQGAYLVQLTSYSVPPVSLEDLKRYAALISGRINQA